MKKVITMVGATVGGAAGWWAGAFVGVFTAFIISCVGTGAGIYFGRRAFARYLE